MVEYCVDDVFGDGSNFIIRTNYPEEIKKGKEIRVVNPNCEFEFDSITRVFDNSIYYAFIVELQILNVDFTNYIPDKSNDGGKYAFADAIIREVKEVGY